MVSDASVNEIGVVALRRCRVYPTDTACRECPGQRGFSSGDACVLLTGSGSKKTDASMG